MKKNVFISLMFLAFGFISISNVEAYETTNQAAFTDQKEKTGVFLIAFAFGHEKYDIHIPISAFSSTEKNNNHLSYSIIDDEEERAIGSTVGLVLSSAKLENGMYVVPKGKKMKFTLIAFYEPNVLETESQFRLQVNHLPFSFGNVQELKLNESELEAYTTERITLVK